MSAALRHPRDHPGIVGAIDVGSYKTVCLLALTERGRPVRIVGVAQRPSQGVRSGAIVDLALAEDTIRSVIAEAEAMSGCRLDTIDVSVSGGRMRSLAFQVRAAVSDGIVSQNHLARLHDAARHHAAGSGHCIIHLSALGLALDGASAPADPVGVRASRLACDFHAVTCEPAALTNLTHVIERCYLKPGQILAAPLASALAVTANEERGAGVTVLDIGADVTGISVLRNGQHVFVDQIASGGSRITRDIACVLQTPLEEAERIKTVYGTLLNALSNGHDVFSYASVQREVDDVSRATKADLARIIQARVAAILDEVRDRLANAGLADTGPGGLIITGGSSQIPGLVAYAESVFRQPVRDGKPRRISGLPPLMCQAGFSGVVGLLEARAQSVPLSPHAHRDPETRHGYFGRVGQWLKEGF